jgi:carboxylesterase type B
VREDTSCACAITCVCACLPTFRTSLGRSPPRPMIAGYNLNDGGSFVGQSYTMNDTVLRDGYFATRFGPNVVSSLQATYPAGRSTVPAGVSPAFMRASDCETDWSYACETEMVADYQAQLSAVRALERSTGTGGASSADLGLPGGFDNDGVYVYEFSQVASSNGLCLHGDDVAYVFGTVTAGASIDALQVSAEMQALWGEFARTGVPSATWPRWSASKADRRLLNITSPQSYTAPPSATCSEFFEPRWDYYEVCLPDNPPLTVS